MRPRNHASATLAAALTGLLAAVPAWAAEVPFTCTTDGLGSWTITALGPSVDTCVGTVDEQCTGMSYLIINNTGRVPTHVAVLVEHDTEVTILPPANITAPCLGDPVTKLGARDCSRKSVKLIRGEETYDVQAEGDRAVIGSSIAVKKGNVTEQCRIASLGNRTFDPNAQLKTSEKIVFKGCTVTIPVDPTTGEPGEATLIGDNCMFIANAAPIDVTSQLVVNGFNVGTPTFGDGSISSGISSCTTRVISRKIYTWCTCGVGDPAPPCSGAS